jgi:hypothetical protein
MAVPKSLGQEAITEVKTVIGDDQINEALKNGWKVYGVPVIPAGNTQFHWMVVKRNGGK